MNNFIDNQTLKKIKQSPMNARKHYRQRERLPKDRKDPGEMDWGEVATSMARNFPKDSAKVFKENVDALRHPVTTVTTLHDLSIEAVGTAIDKLAIQPITKLTGVKSWASTEGESPLFDAVWNYYRDAYGLGPEGIKGFKRYIVNHPAEFLSDVSAIFMPGAKYTGLSAKLLSQNRSGILRRLSQNSRFLKYAPPKVRILLDRAGDLDRFGKAAYYIGTGIDEGGYQPGFWARTAHETLKYMDSMNAALLFGSKGIGVGVGLLSRTTDYPAHIDDIAKQLYTKYHEDFVGMNPKDIDFNLAEFVEGVRLDKRRLPSQHDPDWLYQLRSNQRFQELEKSLINYVGDDNLDRAGLNAINVFREFGDSIYNDLRNKYPNIDVDNQPVTTGLKNTMQTFDTILDDLGIEDKWVLDYQLQFEKAQPQNIGEEILKLLYSYKNKQDNLNNSWKSLHEDNTDLANKIRAGDLTEEGRLVNMVKGRNDRSRWTLKTIRSTQQDISIGDINNFREKILSLMIKYNDNIESKKLVELYEAVTLDYYENLVYSMQSPHNNSMYPKHISESMEDIRLSLRQHINHEFRSKFADENYLKKQEFLIKTKWLQFGKNKDKLADYIINDLRQDTEQQILRDIRMSVTGVGKLSTQMDEKTYRAVVMNAWNETDKFMQTLSDDASTAILAHKEAAKRVDRQFTKVLFGAIDDLDDPAKMRAISNMLFDTDLVDAAMLENIFSQLDEPRSKMLKAALTEKLFNDSRNHEGVWYRIASVDEDVFNWASDDPELARELRDILSVSKGIWGDHSGVTGESMKERFRKLKDDDYMIKDVTDEDIAKIVEYAKNKDYDKILDYMQPEGTSFATGKVKEEGIEKGRPVVRRTGVFTSQSEKLIKKYWDVGWTELEDADKSVIILMYGEDTGGRGLPQPMNEFIVIPTEVINIENPVEFSANLGKGQSAWTPAINLKTQLSRLGERRAKAIWGDAVLADLYKFAEMAESFPGYRKPNAKGKYREKYVENFVDEALKPDTKTNNGIIGLEAMSDIFDTGDPKTTSLNMIFHLLGSDAVIDFLKKSGSDQSILKHFSKEDIPVIQHYLREYRRTYGIAVQKSEKTEKPKREQVVIPYNVDVSPDLQLRHPLK